ncbi:MAG: hypothetical protein OYM47_20180 [Gemmatimonadota bacterium]|nr:hypothetical protein [Gemmatimonadota bacterium]
MKLETEKAVLQAINDFVELSPELVFTHLPVPIQQKYPHLDIMETLQALEARQLIVMDGNMVLLTLAGRARLIALG